MATNKKAAPKARKTMKKKEVNAEGNKPEKKTASAGIRNKDDAQRALRHVPDEKRFYCHDGRILNNIYDLKSALEEMHADTYSHHVTDEKNDFARWVKEVLLDDKLSNELAKCTCAEDAAVIVSERISWLQARA